MAFCTGSSQEDFMDRVTRLETSNLGTNEATLEERVLSDDDDGAFNCSICMEPWSNAGVHRIVSLKCGHLFGFSCIEKWVKRKPSGPDTVSKCPQCNAPARKGDIRPIYCKRLIVSDTSELVLLQKQLQEERLCRKNVESEFAKCRLRLQVDLERSNYIISQLQEANLELRKCLESYSERNAMDTERLCFDGSRFNNDHDEQSHQEINSEPFCGLPNFRFVYKVPITQESNGTRAFSFDKRNDVILVSKTESSNRLTPKHGLLKILRSDPSRVELIDSYHLKPIRDIQTHPFDNGLALTTSWDKHLNIINFNTTNALVASFLLPSAGWSCQWQHGKENVVLAGLGNNTIIAFDTRFSSRPLLYIHDEEKMGASFKAVHSVYSYYDHAQSTNSVHGSNFGGSYLFNVDSDWQQFQCKPMDCTLTSQSQCTSTSWCDGWMFSSYRERNSTLFRLFPLGGWETKWEKSLNAMQTVISKPCIFKRDHTSDQYILAFGDPHTKDIVMYAYQPETSSILPCAPMTIKGTRDILDSKYFEVQQQRELMVLTDMELHLFRDA